MILQEEYIKEILLEFELEKRSSLEYRNLHEYYSGERIDEFAPLAVVARALPTVARSAAQFSANTAKALSSGIKNGVASLSKNVTKSLSNAAKEATNLLHLQGRIRKNLRRTRKNLLPRRSFRNQRRDRDERLMEGS